MKTGAEIVDSKRLSGYVDGLVKLWADKNSNDSEKAGCIDTFLEAIGEVSNGKTRLGVSHTPIPSVDHVAGGEYSGGVEGTQSDRRPREYTNDLGNVRRKRRTKAQMQEASKAETEAPSMGKEETRLMALEADKLAKIHKPASEVLADYVSAQIKPYYDRGMRHFLVPLQWKQRQLTVNQEVWKQVLEAQGVGFTELEWTYDQRNWHGPVPHEGTMPLVIA